MEITAPLTLKIQLYIDEERVETITTLNLAQMAPRPSCSYKTGHIIGVGYWRRGKFLRKDF